MVRQVLDEVLRCLTAARHSPAAVGAVHSNGCPAAKASNIL